MNQNKKLEKIRKIIFPIIVTAVFILSVSIVSSLGVSPASKTIYFQPNSSVELQFEIINSEQIDFEAGLSASGELKDMIFFENQSLKVSSSSYRIPFEAIIKFPAYLEPGIHDTEIKITPVPKESSSGMFNVYIAPQIPLHIKVPYPYKYADVSLVVLDVDEGTPVPVFVEFDNMGSENIVHAGASVEIYGSDNKLVGNISAPDIEISRSSFGKTQAQPSPILKKGLYHAVVNAHYDGFSRTIETNLSLGEPLVRIKALMVKTLFANEINKVPFKVQSEWNAELHAAGMIKIGEKQEELPGFDISSNEEKEITGFFDATGLKPGEYVLSITLAYANQLRTESYPIVISEKTEKPRPVSATIIILLIILALALSLLMAIIIVKNRKIKKEKNN